MKAENIEQSLLSVARTTILICSLCIVSGCALDFDLFDEDKIPTCKNDCTIIKGRILTDGGTTPIPNLTLHLAWSDPCMGCFFGSGYRDIATTTTDNEGNYEFEFASADHELKYGYYDISFDYPGLPYFDFGYGNGFGVTAKTKGATVVYDFLLPKVGQIQLMATNPEAIGEDEYLVLQRYFKYADLSEQEWGCNLSAKNANTVICPAAVSQYNYIRVAKKKGGVSSVLIDSVYVVDGNKVYYQATF